MTVRAASQPSAPIILAKSAVAVSCPSDTTEDVLATLNIPVLAPNSMLRLTTEWSMTTSANNKTLRVRFSGGAGTIVQNAGFTASQSARMQVQVSNRGATNSQISVCANNTGFTATNSASIPTAVDTSVATTLVITGQKVLNTETLTLESYLLELI